eukprot:ANDGO_03313.mRNA.1 ADP-ribosylation factor-like protein 2-binding protein OS=Gallus gallus GN=ARL2BP PE=2 SV=1
MSIAMAQFYGSDAGDTDEFEFSHCVGTLQEILLDAEFFNLRMAFMRAHCHEFDKSDENKLIYTALFEEYVRNIEGFLETRLKSAIPGFSMVWFLTEIERRGQDEVCGDLWDLLASLADFAQFKGIMLDAKRSQKGKNPENAIQSGKVKST